MKDYPTVKHGDFVRVVIEGEAEVNDSLGRWARVGDSSAMFGSDEVKSVEIVKQPVKVSDKITLAEAARLPVASVVEDEDMNHYFVTRHGGLRWAGTGERRTPGGAANVTVRYLPGSA